MSKASIFFGAMVITLTVLTANIGQAEAAIVEKNVEYLAQGVVLKGYLAYEDTIT